MSGKALLLGVLVVAGAVGAYMVWSPSPEGAGTPGEAITAPPEGAAILDPEWNPGAVMLGVAGNRALGAPASPPMDFVGMWVGEPGWNGGVEEVTQEAGGVALRMYLYDNKIIGGGLWVVALVQAEDPSIYKGKAVTVRGRIDRVEVLPGDLTPTHRIVLKPAWVVGG